MWNQLETSSIFVPIERILINLRIDTTGQLVGNSEVHGHIQTMCG